jgi:hypothetical protein
VPATLERPGNLPPEDACTQWLMKELFFLSEKETYSAIIYIKTIHRA